MLVKGRERGQGMKKVGEVWGVLYKGMAPSPQKSISCLRRCRRDPSNSLGWRGRGPHLA